jgi:curved DNA-binding protein CbpA
MFLPTMQTSSSELFQACETIFGSNVKVSSDFLECLQPVGIKTAFRKRAFNTHPDRAKALGAFVSDLNAEFVNVRQAYERLLVFVKKRNEGTARSSLFNGFRTKQEYSDQSPKNSSSQNMQHKAGQKMAHHNKKQNNHPDHFYTGSFPKGNLMLGQFLYYSGLISWQTLIEAICWQRSQRPLIGQIAVSWKLISYQDVLRILNIRTFDEKFGECALRTGYISSFEQLALVGKQKKLQRPFGEYFIKSGILSSMDLMNIAQKQQFHNMTSH